MINQFFDSNVLNQGAAFDFNLNGITNRGNQLQTNDSQIMSVRSKKRPLDREAECKGGPEKAAKLGGINSDIVSSLASKIAAAKYEDLISLAHPYKGIENLEFNLGRRRVNLYPTRKVREIFDKYKTENFQNLEKVIKSAFQCSILKISEDATLYLPEEFVVANKNLEIKDNKLFRSKLELEAEKTYIFVLSRKNQLFVTQKKNKDNKHGRIHHSSLTSGQAVRTAGMIKITKNEDGSYIIKITNESGHYKPTPATVDKVIDWLTAQGLKFMKKEDRSEVNQFGEIRTVILQTIN